MRATVSYVSRDRSSKQDFYEVQQVYPFIGVTYTEDSGTSLQSSHVLCYFFFFVRPWSGKKSAITAFIYEFEVSKRSHVLRRCDQGSLLIAL